MTDTPTRAELDDSYCWDLAGIFETGDDWAAEREAVAAAVDDLRGYRGRAVDSPGALGSVLELVEELRRRDQRLGLYARLRRNENVEDGANEDRLREYRALKSDLDAAVAAVAREVARADPDRVREFVRRGGLERYDRYVETLLGRAEHVRGPAVEELLADLDEVVDAPVRHVRVVLDRDLDSPTVEGPDGDPVEVTRTRYRAGLRHPDREYRRRVYEAYHEALERHRHTLAAAYADKLKAQARLADARRYGSAREMAFRKPCYPETGMRVSLPESVHDAALDAVRANLDPLHRYYRLRADRLGVDDLRPWDRTARIAGPPEPTVPYEAAREHVLAAVEPLGEDYRDTLADFLDDDRVDVYETERKRSDVPAYCPSAYDAGAYVLMNYADDVQSLFFLVHELGHAMHVEYLRGANPPASATCPRPFEEVPSVLHELLLVDHLREAGDPALRAHAWNRLLHALQGNFFGAALWSQFTHRTYRLVEGGDELTADRADRVHADLRAEFYPGVAEADGVRSPWLASSLARKPYHYYQYVLGVAGALGVHRRLRDGSLSVGTYREVLRSTGRTDAVALFDRLGMDLESAAPFEAAAEAFAGFLDDAVLESA